MNRTSNLKSSEHCGRGRNPLIPVPSIFAIAALFLASLLVQPACAQSSLHYEKHFDKGDVGKVPDEFLVLDGQFTVKEEAGNQFLELPGSPLDSYAVQFGPSASSNVTATATIRSSSRGRRYPSFGIGLGGVSGFKLQVSPGKKQIELCQDQAIKKSLAYEWKSGEWTSLRLQIVALADGKYQVSGKAWQKGSPEPKDWMITLETSDAPSSGRPSVFGSPFAGTPIQFDDLKVDEAK